MAPDVLELESRRHIYRHLQAHPGKYLRELQRELGMGMGGLEYHLHELEKAGLVTCLLEGHKRFFPNDVPRADRRRLALLRQKTPRRILLLTLAEGVVAKSRLLTGLDLPRSTLNHHIGHLVKHRLLVAGREGKEAVYQVQEEGDVMRLLVAYQTSWLDRRVDAFLDGTDALR